MSVKDLVFRLLGEDVTASGAMGKLAKTADKSAKGIKESFGPVPGAITLVAVAGTAATIKMASDFQSQMTLLQTAGGESAKNIKTVSDGILNMAASTGTSVSQLSEGMYTIEKAGIRGADGLKVLKAAAEGAKAENVDLGTATNALTSVMMSYHMKASDAVKVQNMLVAGSGMAKTTMQEYAGSLAAVIPVASAAGIGFDQVGGAIATLTQHGTSAQEATQELANTIRGLQAPSQVAQTAMQQIGLNVTDVSQNLGKRGLTGTIDLITQAIASKMGPSGLVMADSFKKSQSAAADAQIELTKLPKSLQAVAKEYLNGTVTQSAWRKELKGMTVDHRQLAQQFALTVNHSRGFNDMLKSGSPAAQTFAGMLSHIMGGATGMNTALMLGGENMAYFKKATEEVGAAGKKSGTDISTWAKTQATFNVQVDEAKQGVSELGIRIGTALLPGVQGALKVAVAWTKALSENKPALIAVIAVVGTFTALMIGAYAAQKLMAAGAALLKVWTLGTTVAQWGYNTAVSAADGTLTAAAASGMRNFATMIATQATSLAESIALWAMYAAEWVSSQAVAFGSFLARNAVALGSWVATTAVNLARGAALWVANSAKTVAALAVQNGAMIAQKAVVIGGAAAMGIATAAQWAWNVAMDANPIVLIVLAIAALVAALVWFFTQTKLGQDIWKNFTKFLGDAWKNFSDFFATVWNGLVQWFQDAIGNVVKFVQQHWGLLLSFIIGPIGLAIQWIVDNWSGIVSFFQATVGKIGAFFGGIGSAIQNAFSGAIGFVRHAVNGVIDVINSAIGGINTLIKGVNSIPGVSVPTIPNIPHFAAGGTMPHDGLALVGEKGPELVRLPGGAHVYPNGTGPTQSGGGGVHIGTFIAQQNQSPAEIAQELGWMQRWAT